MIKTKFLKFRRPHILSYESTVQSEATKTVRVFDKHFVFCNLERDVSQYNRVKNDAYSKQKI
jgi:hypothetical protein